MALTRDFKELVQKQAAADPAYAEALLRESIDMMLAGRKPAICLASWSISNVTPVSPYMSKRDHDERAIHF